MNQLYAYFCLSDSLADSPNYQVVSCSCAKGKSCNERKEVRSPIPVPAKQNTGPRDYLPPVSVRTDDAGHWPSQGNQKGRCKMPGCKGIVKTRCLKCKISLCITSERNCFVDFHTGWTAGRTSDMNYIGIFVNNRNMQYKLWFGSRTWCPSVSLFFF